MKFVIVGDPHGDELDPHASAAFFDFLDDFRPEIVIHAGDNWNFSYLRNGASEAEADADSDPDWTSGTEFMVQIFKRAKKRIFLRGNHDERPYHWVRKARREDVRKHAMSVVRDIEKLTQKLKVHMLPYDSRLGVFDLDGIRTVHGYAHGAGAARSHASSYGTCAFAHTHSAEVGIVERWPEPSVAFGTGCLLKIDQDYNSTQRAKLRHENSWIAGITDGIKASYFQCKKNALGQFVCVTEARAYGAIADRGATKGAEKSGD